MPLPEIIAPAWVSRIVAHLPGRPPRLALVLALNTMLKKGLLPADMSLFAGRKFEIDVLDAGIKVRFGADDQKFLDQDYEGAPDLRLAANGIDFLLITKNLLDSVDWPFSQWLLKRGMSA